MSKAHKIADVDRGAAELELVMTAMYGEDWQPKGNGWGLSDAEHAEWQARQMEKLYSEIASEHAAHRESHIQLQQVRRILRTFALAPVTMSSLQPVLDLAKKLNPSLSDELSANDNPFI